MDAKDSTVRRYLAQRAELLGAIRLPNDAFKKNAGAEVVSDIIFLQKRDRPLDIVPEWTQTGQTEDGFAINRYFLDHPEMVLGRQEPESTAHGMDYTVNPIEGLELADQLHDAVKYIRGTYQEAELPELGEGEAIDTSIPADPNVKNYSYTVVDGTVYFRENSRMVRPDLNSTAEARVKGLVGLRECVQQLIDLQMDAATPDSAIQDKQAELNRLYDSFSAKYGLINDRANRLAFADDSSYYLLCALEVIDEDGKLERVEGDPLDPCANGRLCMRCLNLAEGVNYADRPKYPLRRAGERGENKWERITWEEALDEIADWIHENLDEAGFGRESIFVNHGTGRNISSWVPFLGGACLGTPNIGAIGFSGYSCYLPRTCGTAAGIGDFPIVDASEGHEDRYANPEWERPDVVVIWGCEPLRSNADGYLGHWLNVCMQMGTEFISIDPQLTWWGARAEYWLPIRPATDLPLALAWLNVITQEDLVDHEFIEYWCAYYDELKEHVAQFTPEWAAEICEVPAEDIAAAARF